MSQWVLSFFFFLLIPAATYANAILAASTPSSSQAPLTSFSIQFHNKVPGSPIFNKRSQWPDKVKNFSPKFITSNAWGRQLRAMAPKPVLTKYSVLKKYPSRISKLRVHYNHKRQPCVPSPCFQPGNYTFFVSQTFHAKKKGKASSAFKYQCPQFLLKATSPCQGSITWEPASKKHQHNSQLTNTLARSTAAVWSWYYTNSLLESKLFARKIFCYPLFQKKTSNSMQQSKAFQF